jgi:hypothetical protein
MCCYPAYERRWRAVGWESMRLARLGSGDLPAAGLIMGLFVSVNADPTWCLESVTQLGVEDFHGNRGLLL